MLRVRGASSSLRRTQKKGETDSAQSYASFTARLQRGAILAVSGDAARRPESSQAHLVAKDQIVGKRCGDASVLHAAS